MARRRLAELIEAEPGDIVVDMESAGVLVAGSTDTAMSFAELAEKEPLSVKSTFVAEDEVLLEVRVPRAGDKGWAY